MAEINQDKIKDLLEKGDIDQQIEAVQELQRWLIEKLNQNQKEIEERLKKLNG